MSNVHDKHLRAKEYSIVYNWLTWSGERNADFLTDYYETNASVWNGQLMKKERVNGCENRWEKIEKGKDEFRIARKKMMLMNDTQFLSAMSKWKNELLIDWMFDSNEWMN